MANWLNEYRKDRKSLVEKCREIGQAEMARRCGVNEMVISRFVRGKGSNDAITFYRIAAACADRVWLIPADQTVRVGLHQYEQGRSYH